MRTTSRLYAALSGLLATVGALSFGELVAGLVSRWYSPTLAVGDTVIFYTPRPVKDFAIAVFGTNDKIALIAGTLIITLLFGMGLGDIGRKRLPIAWAGIVLFGVIGVAATVFQDSLVAAVPSALTAVVGVGLITLLLRLAPVKGASDVAATTPVVAPAADRAPSAAPDGSVPAPPAPDGERAADDREPAVVAAGPTTDDALTGSAVGVAGDRRRFLALSGGVAVGSMAAVAGGRALVAREQQGVADARTAIADQIGQTGAPATEGATESALRPLGLVDDPLPALPDGLEVDVDGVEPFQTPDADFYRIDIELAVPQINPDTWSLRIHGMVDNELEFSYEDLLRRDDLIESDITLTCVSNEVGGDLMSSGRWTGIPLVNLLAEAGVQDGADQLVGRDGNDFTTGFPVEVLDDGRDAMLALLLNGEPLSPERGFPARVIVPGLYGYVSATKWITEIELTTFADFDQYWVVRGWDEEAPIKTQSRIDVPAPLSRVPMGDIAIGGVAWAQRRGIERVEIRVDDGEWQDVELADQLNVDTWRQWKWVFNPEAPGNYRLTVRATDGEGNVQGEERQPPFPNGAEGWMTLLVTVTDA